MFLNTVMFQAIRQYGSGIRFSKSSINSTIYATNKDGDIGTGHFFADKLYGDLTAKGSNAYILVDAHTYNR